MPVIELIFIIGSAVVVLGIVGILLTIVMMGGVIGSGVSKYSGKEK